MLPGAVTTQLLTAEATVKSLEYQVSALSDDLKEARNKNKKQKLETSAWERIEEKKKSSIIIDGIPENITGTLIYTVNQLLSDISIHIQPGQILTAFTVTRVNNPRPQLILVKLSSPTIEYKICKHVKQLKDNDTWNRVYILTIYQGK